MQRSINDRPTSRSPIKQYAVPDTLPLGSYAALVLIIHERKQWSTTTVHHLAARE